MPSLIFLRINYRMDEIGQENEQEIVYRPCHFSGTFGITCQIWLYTKKVTKNLVSVVNYR